MPLKIDQPLFADRASGKFWSLGVFRHIEGRGTFLYPSQGGNPDPSSMPVEQRNNFAYAHAQWMLISPTWHAVNGRRRLSRKPDWPTFSENWYSSTLKWGFHASTVNQEQGAQLLASTLKGRPEDAHLIVTQGAQSLASLLQGQPMNAHLATIQAQQSLSSVLRSIGSDASIIANQAPQLLSSGLSHS